MKTRKLFTLLMAAVLLVASLGLTVHADVNEYSFDGSCKKFFTTKRSLQREDKNWSAYDVSVLCTSLSFTKSTSYNSGYCVLMTESGTQYGSAKEIKDSGSAFLPVPNSYSYETMRVRFIHPYYNANESAASYKMHIVGSVHMVTLV